MASEEGVISADYGFLWFGRQGVYAICCSVDVPSPREMRERGSLIIKDRLQKNKK